jgi:acyl dehydratase
MACRILDKRLSFPIAPFHLNPAIARAKQLFPRLIVSSKLGLLFAFASTDRALIKLFREILGHGH